VTAKRLGHIRFTQWEPREAQGRHRPARAQLRALPDGVL